MNEHESAAMRQLYSKSNESICIKSTFKKLQNILPSWINVGEIIYLDYEKESIPTYNAFWPILHKRKSFQHEQEIRAVAWEMLSGNLGGNIIRSTMTNEGVYVPVELNNLIDTIYVNPNSPDWFLEAVKWVVLESKLITNIEKSSLSNSPLY
jgi:hypothetical protein